MTIKYDVGKLQSILRDYTRLTGLSIAVVDRDCRHIAASHSERGTFCRSIQKSELGIQKCQCSDMELLGRCARSHHAEFHICHAGLADAAIPLVKDQVTIGYVLLGRIRRGENIEDICNRLDWMDEDYEKLNESFQSMVYYDEEQVQSAINLAIAITTFILVDDMVKMEYNHVIESAVSYIQKNLNQDLSVDELCDQLKVSKNVLYENFRLSLNTTVSDYVSHCRMERAKELLRNSFKPISQVAEEVGIDNYTYFIKLFKKRTGTTPLQYRKQNQNSSYTGG